jgi:hypothetical protein
VSHILDLLNEVRVKKLGMYVGRTSLSKLADFLRGYDYAIDRLHPGQEDPFLADFRDWIQEKFGTTKHSWEDIIQMQSASDEEAVKRFWELLDEFLQQRKGTGAAPAAAPFSGSEVPGLAAPLEGRPKA